MNSDKLDQNHTGARLSKLLPMLVLSTSLLFLLLYGLNSRTQAGQARPAGENLVPNPGFETPGPAFWRHEESSPPSWGYRWWRIAHEGDHSAETFSNDDSCIGQWWSDPVTVTAGLPYDFSGWITTIDVSDRAFLTLAFYTSTHPITITPPLAGFDSSQINGSTAWTEVVGSAIAPDGARYARLHCKSKGQGTVWFDDVFVGLAGTPVLVISKSDTPDPVKPGEGLIYTITYSNTGNVHATQCVIMETYDINVEFEKAAPMPDADDRVWDIGTLDPGESDFIVITVTVSSPLPSGLTLTNAVEMDCQETDAVTYTTTTKIVPRPYSVFLPLVLEDFNAFCNGGFETGDFACWTHGGELDQSVQCEVADEGNCAALLGSLHYPCQNGQPIGEAWISQTFSIPSCPNPLLAFKYRVFSSDLLDDDKWDSFDVYIDDSLILRDGNTDWIQASCDRHPWDSGWRHFSYDLSDYSGDNVQLSFHNVSRGDHYYNTWTYVDQVEVFCKP